MLSGCVFTSMLLFTGCLENTGFPLNLSLAGSFCRTTKDRNIVWVMSGGAKSVVFLWFCHWWGVRGRSDTCVFNPSALSWRRMLKR